MARFHELLTFLRDTFGTSTGDGSQILRVFQKAVGARGREVGELWERVIQLCDSCGIVVDRFAHSLRS